MKVKFTRHPDGSCSLNLQRLTQGKMLALVHAISEYRSIVAEDVRIAIRNSVQENISSLHKELNQDIFEGLNQLP
jgi:hypothetical protein